jgi:hypothetical protein
MAVFALITISHPMPVKSGRVERLATSRNRRFAAISDNRAPDLPRYGNPQAWFLFEVPRIKSEKYGECNLTPRS